MGVDDIQPTMKQTYSALIVIIFSVSSSCFRLPDNSEETQCRTGEGYEGECVKITVCRTYTKHLMKQLDTETSNLFRKSHCGFDTAMPKVCCVFEDVSSMNSMPSYGSDLDMRNGKSCVFNPKLL